MSVVWKKPASYRRNAAEADKADEYVQVQAAAALLADENVRVRAAGALLADENVQVQAAAALLARRRGYRDFALELRRCRTRRDTFVRGSKHVGLLRQ